VLDRPPLNVLNLPMLAELEKTCALLSNERSLKCVVLRGAGRAFCAGVDVADHTPDRVERMLELFHGAVRRLMALPCPVVAAVNGAALGGGCELLMACDVVLARDDARIGQPEIRLGAFPPVAAAVLPRLIGRQRALDLVLTGRTLSAEEAREMGLVTRVLAAETFERRGGRSTPRCWRAGAAPCSGWPSARCWRARSSRSRRRSGAPSGSTWTS
jgi:cyclohexa-1,5-dienecarbonyl-CoA hydratase